LGVWALAGSIRNKLNNSVVDVFVIMEGPFFGVKYSEFLSRSPQIDWRKCGWQALSAKGFLALPRLG